jgi:6-phosphofructokinase 1
VEIITSSKKLVDVQKFYNTDRLRPIYNSFEFMPQMIL